MEDDNNVDPNPDPNPDPNLDPNPNPDPQPWHLAEGIEGQGDRPEFFKADKYANITEQAKAYSELEAKLGAFAGAPEEYEIAISDELKEGGIEIDADDPIMSSAIEFAKSINMNQDGFHGMINLYGMAKLAEAKALDEKMADEFKALGDKAEARIESLNQWASANLPTGMIDGFKEMVVSADGVKAMEQIISLTRAAPVDPPGDPVPGGVTAEEVNKLQFELDENGNRRMQSDPDFRKMVEKKMDELWGTKEHITVVG